MPQNGVRAVTQLLLPPLFVIRR